MRRNLKSLLATPKSAYRLFGLAVLWQTLGLLLGIGFVFIFSAVLYFVFLLVDFWEWDLAYDFLYKFAYNDSPPRLFKKRRRYWQNTAMCIFYSALAIIPISLGILLVKNIGFLQQNLIYLVIHQ